MVETPSIEAICSNANLTAKVHLSEHSGALRGTMSE